MQARTGWLRPLILQPAKGSSPRLLSWCHPLQICLEIVMWGSYIIWYILNWSVIIEWTASDTWRTLMSTSSSSQPPSCTGSWWDPFTKSGSKKPLLISTWSRFPLICGYRTLLLFCFGLLLCSCPTLAWAHKLLPCTSYCSLQTNLACTHRLRVLLSKVTLK